LIGVCSGSWFWDVSLQVTKAQSWWQKAAGWQDARSVVTSPATSLVLITLLGKNQEKVAQGSTSCTAVAGIETSNLLIASPVPLTTVPLSQT